MKQIQKADPATRRLTIRLVVVMFVVGISMISLLEINQQNISHWFEANIDDMVNNAWLVIIACLVMIAPIVIFALYLFQFGLSCIRSRRFPPPETRVIRDTPILEGDTGARRGQIIVGLSIMLKLLSLGFVIVLWRLFASLENAF